MTALTIILSLWMLAAAYVVTVAANDRPEEKPLRSTEVAILLVGAPFIMVAAAGTYIVFKLRRWGRR